MLNSFAEIEVNYLSHAINQKRFEQSRKAARLWPEVISYLESETSTKISSGQGTFLVSENYRGSLESDNFDEIAQTLRHFHEPYQIVDLNDIPGYLPTIEGKASKAIFIENEGWVDVQPTINAFEKGLLTKGVKFIDLEITKVEGSKSGVVKLVDSKGEKYQFDKLLIAAGAASKLFLESLGATEKNPFLLYGVGNTLRLKARNLKQSYVIRTPNRGLACGLYSAPYLNEELVVGATNFVTDEPKSLPGVEEVHSLLAMAQRELNSNLSFAEILRINTGWRPISSDGVPIIGKTAVSNVYICTGTRRDGWHLSALLCVLISNLICTDNVPEELEIYRMNRNPYRFLTVEESIKLCTKHYISGMLQHGLNLPRGNYEKHIENNYEMYFAKLHDNLGLTEYGIPVELVGYISSKLAKGVRVSI